MDYQNLEFEELLIAEALSLALHGLDLVVSPFEGTGADRVVVVSQ